MTDNIYQKLQTIQSNIGQLTKTEENKFQKYKYVSEQEILKLLRPLLKEHNLILTFSDLPESFTSEKVEKE
jgi:ERF superfamily